MTQNNSYTPNNNNNHLNFMPNYNNNNPHQTSISLVSYFKKKLI